MAVPTSVITLMKFDTGFSVDFDSFDGADQRYTDILKLFVDQGLKLLMSNRVKICIPEIKEWVHTCRFETGNILVGKISGSEVHLTPAVLTEIFGLDNGDDDLDLTREEFTTMLNVMGFSDGNPNHLLKTNFSMEYRFLADLVGKVLLAKHSAHDHINKLQFSVMSVLVSGRKINWGLFLFDYLKQKCLRKVNVRKELKPMAVEHGRVLGIFLSEKASHLLATAPTFLNASKRLTASLFGKWDRVIPKKSSLGDIPSSSSNPPQTTTIITPPVTTSSPTPSHPIQDTVLETALETALPSPPHSPTHFISDEFTSTIPPLSTQIPTTLPFTLPSSSTLLPSTSITLPTISTTIPSPTIPSTSIPSTSRIAPQSAAQFNADIHSLSVFADYLYSLLYPKFQEQLTASLAPIIKSLDTISSKIDQFVPSSSKSLSPEYSAPKQGENLGEDEEEVVENVVSEGVFVDISQKEVADAEEQVDLAITVEQVDVDEEQIVTKEVADKQSDASVDEHVDVLADEQVDISITEQNDAVVETVNKSVAEQDFEQAAEQDKQDIVPKQDFCSSVIRLLVPELLNITSVHEITEYFITEDIISKIADDYISQILDHAIYWIPRNILKEFDKEESIAETVDKKGKAVEATEKITTDTSKKDKADEESSDSYFTDSEDSIKTQKRKRRNHKEKIDSKKAKTEVIPKEDIPYYIKHNIPFSDKLPDWQKYTKKEFKERKQLRNFYRGSRGRRGTSSSGRVPWIPSGRTPISDIPQKPQVSKTYQKRFSKTTEQIYDEIDFDIPAVDPTEPEIEKTQAESEQLIRSKELAVLAQIRRAKEKGEDTSQLSTMSEFREKELKRYKVKFNYEEWMKKHPQALPLPATDAICIPGTRLPVIGAHDLKMTRKEAYDPNREMKFKKKDE